MDVGEKTFVYVFYARMHVSHAPRESVRRGKDANNIKNYGAGEG
jgi:hypothetical protein